MSPTIRQVVRRAGLRRAHVQSLRTRLERRVVPTLPRPRPARAGGRTLCYHSVGCPQEWGYNDVSPGALRAQLELALRRGYRFIPARAVAEGVAGPEDLAVTFDDGSRTVLENAAPILSELGIPWTLFVVSDFAAGRHPHHPGSYLRWPELRELSAQGVEIGSHSLDHPNFASLDAGAAWRQLYASRQVLEDELGIPVETFAIPDGTSRDWPPACRGLARQAGYRVVFAASESRRAPGTAPRTFVTGFDSLRTFGAALRGAFDDWQEWT